MIIAVLLVEIEEDEEDEEDEEILDEKNEKLDYLLMEYYKLHYLPSVPRHPLRSAQYLGGGRSCIEHFSEDSCYNYFRFTKDDLIELMRCLRLPREGKQYLDNGAYLMYEEIVLFSLHRFSTQGGSMQLSAELIFDGRRHYTAYSRGFNWFCEYLLQRFSYLLTDNFEYWVQYFPMFAEAIRKKVNSKCAYPVGHEKYFYFKRGDFRVFGFFDCCVSEISRPGTGPLAGGGPGAPRGRVVGENGVSIQEQEAFFNNWKKYCGLKHLTIESIFGMCIYLYGPDSFIRNDNRLVNESGVNNLLERAQLNWYHELYSVYGDRIFVCDTCISRAYSGDPTPRQLHINSCMSSVRIANEWNYGLTYIKFPFVNTPSKLKLKSHPNVAHYYKIATLLRNANACCYGTGASLYFDVTPPSLSHYFRL